MAPERYDSRRNGTWGHWVPLVVTLSLATAGVAAWAWSQRRDSDSDDDEPGLVYGNANTNANNQGAQGAAGGYASQYDASSSRAHAAPSVGDETVGAAGSDVSGWGARMSGALRRTPSPQQFLDSTGKTVAAGFAAAGAAMGKALSSIREDDDGRGPYPDGNPWSEEADAKAERAPLTSPRHRKTVAIVVSADSLGSTEESSAGYFEHAVCSLP